MRDVLDLVTRNAVVFDGSGMPPFRGGVGVKEHNAEQLYAMVAPPDVLTRNPEAFATLMGLHDPYGVHGDASNYHHNFKTGYANSVAGHSQHE